MRLTALALGLVGTVGAAQADDRDYDLLHRYDSSDYAAQVFYRASFGSMQGPRLENSYGFKAYSERARIVGAPDTFRADFGSEPRFALNGIDLRAFALVNRQNQGGILGSLTTGQLLTVVVAGAIVIGGTAAALDDDDVDACTPTGTGSATTC